MHNLKEQFKDMKIELKWIEKNSNVSLRKNLSVCKLKKRMQMLNLMLNANNVKNLK